MLEMRRSGIGYCAHPSSLVCALPLDVGVYLSPLVLPPHLLRSRVSAIYERCHDVDFSCSRVSEVLTTVVCRWLQVGLVETWIHYTIQYYCQYRIPLQHTYRFSRARPSASCILGKSTKTCIYIYLNHMMIAFTLRHMCAFGTRRASTRLLLDRTKLGLLQHECAICITQWANGRLPFDGVTCLNVLQSMWCAKIANTGMRCGDPAYCTVFALGSNLHADLSI